MKRWMTYLVAFALVMSITPVAGAAKPASAKPNRPVKITADHTPKAKIKTAKAPKISPPKKAKKPNKGKGMTTEDRTQIRAMKAELKQVHAQVSALSKTNQALADAISDQIATSTAVFSPEVLQSVTNKMAELKTYVQSYKTYLQESRTELARAKSAGEAKDGARAVEAISANLQIMKSRLALKQHINTVLNSIAELVGLGVPVTP